jgi:hypothetical protein
MKIVNGETYIVKSKSDYFKKKCRNPNPEIVIEGTDKEVFGKPWDQMHGNPCALNFAFRMGKELGQGIRKVDWFPEVYYGKIKNTAYLVAIDELEKKT